MCQMCHICQPFFLCKLTLEEKLKKHLFNTIVLLTDILGCFWLSVSVWIRNI